MRPKELSDDAQKVLSVLRKSASDGYTLMSRTGLDPKKLETAVGELVDMDLVEVKGEQSAANLGEAYLFVTAQAKGRSKYFGS
jgi:hypothetical protein